MVLGRVCSQILLRDSPFTIETFLGLENPTSMGQESVEFIKLTPAAREKIRRTPAGEGVTAWSIGSGENFPGCVPAAKPAKKVADTRLLSFVKLDLLKNRKEESNLFCSASTRG